MLKIKKLKTSSVCDECGRPQQAGTVVYINDNGTKTFCSRHCITNSKHQKYTDYLTERDIRVVLLAEEVMNLEDLEEKLNIKFLFSPYLNDEEVEEVRVETPFGEPSDAILTPCSTALSLSTNSPPSLNESGVTFNTPITIHPAEKSSRPPGHPNIIPSAISNLKPNTTQLLSNSFTIR